MTQTAERPTRQMSPGRRLSFIAFVATIGAFAFGYDTGVISGALPLMTLPRSEGGLDLGPVTEGIVSSSLIFGAAFGAIIGGRLSDRRGRRTNLLTLALVFLVGALGTALAPNFAVMVVFRFVLGFAVGGASATVPTFIAELAPSNRRARLVSRNELMIVVGQLVSYTSNAVIGNLFPSDNAWRWMLALAVLPASALFIGMLFAPESPRWLASAGRMEDARAVLEQVRDGDVQVELDEMGALAEHNRAAGKVTRAELRVPWVRRIITIGLVFGILVQLTGVNAVMYYAPTILVQTGLGTGAALTATVGNGVVAVIATLLGIYLLGNRGRRAMILTGEAGVIASLTALGLCFMLLPESTVRSYVILALMLTFLFFVQAFVSIVFWLAMSEIFPLRFRGFAVGLAVFAQWISNAAVTLLFPVLIKTFGGPTFFIFAAINVGTFIFLWRFLPETKGRSLEGLERELETGVVEIIPASENR